MPKVRMFDHRNQMPDGILCLFQREPRNIPGGDTVRGIDVLRRAEQWFLGLHTGHWPPDSAESELDTHFRYLSDILLSQRFFSSDFNGYGRFFMVHDIRRLADAKIEGHCPMIVTAVTEESSGLVKVFDAREDLSRVYPWIQNEAWDPDKIATLEENTQSRQRYIAYGYWWSIPHEPRPFQNGAGLLRELSAVSSTDEAWQKVSSLLKGEVSTEEEHFLGLRYPGRHEGVEWLIVWMHRGERKGPLLIKSDEEKRRGFEEAPVLGCFRVHSVRPTDLRFRNTGVVNSSVSEKTVALIGLGALGSTVAELLAKAGVGKFRLCDSDHLRTGNVARHIGGLGEFGAPKTHVVQGRLLEINPYLIFSEGDVMQGSAVGSLDRLAEFLATADLVICTTADEGVESIINQVAVIHRKPILYGRALRRGNIGRVFLVRPGKDACKACLAEYARAGRNGETTPRDWIDVTEPEEDILLHECGRPVIPASAVDLAFIATLLGRLALNFLEGKTEESNHWLWSQSPAPEVDSRLEKGMQVFSGYLEPRVGCPACQEPAVVSLVMHKDVQNTILSLTEASPEEETGGILIGFVDEKRQAVVMRATGPGPRADKSKARFARDVEYVQNELKRAASELGPRGLYLGEWHSHIEADPQPSPTDIESLAGIAMASNYLTRCPAMIIVGFDPRTKKVSRLSSWAFPVGRRMWTIENKILATEENSLGVPSEAR